MKTRIRQLTEQEKRSLGEKQMIADWLEIFPKGILSIVSDTFDLWKLITEYLPANKEAIMARDGKLVIRPDSGNPVDIICGVKHYKWNDKLWSLKEGRERGGDYDYEENGITYLRDKEISEAESKGVIELLWDIFGGTVNEQGYKVLDPHIGAIYGDSINVERQVEIYKRLEAKGFAATNIVLGVGSYTMIMQTRDSAGFAAKGAWFEVEEFGANGGYGKNQTVRKQYNIYKDPVTDDGTKKSLKGLLKVYYDGSMETYKALGCPPDGSPKPIIVKTECTPEEEQQGLLQVIYENGKFFNQTTLTEIRNKIKF